MILSFFAHVILAFPYWTWPLVTLLGLIAYLLTSFGIAIPGVTATAYLVRLVSIAAMVIGLFFSGAAWIDAIENAQLKKAEAKIAIAEARADQLTADLAESRKKFIDSNVKKDIAVHRAIQDQVVILDKNCRVPKSAVVILNEAAK
jgi:predicted membrane protein